MSEPTPTPPSPTHFDPVIDRIYRRRAMKSVILTLIVFLCGGVAGWGIAVIHHRPPPPMMGMGPGPQPPLDDMVQQLRAELLLTDEQTKKVHDIYQEREDALRSIREKMEPQLKSEYDQLDKQMKDVLNAAQYQRWSERFQSVRNRMLPPPPPRGPRPFPGGPPPDGFGGPPPPPDGFGPNGPGPDGPHRGPPPDGMPPPR